MRHLQQLVLSALGTGLQVSLTHPLQTPQSLDCPKSSSSTAGIQTPHKQEWHKPSCLMQLVLTNSPCCLLKKIRQTPGQFCLSLYLKSPANRCGASFKCAARANPKWQNASLCLLSSNCLLNRASSHGSSLGQLCNVCKNLQSSCLFAWFNNP